MVMSLRSKWAVGKARGGLAVEGASRTILRSDLVFSRRYKMGRDVTDEQRSRRPIFNATLRATASWLFFRVARSARMNSDMGALPPVRLGPP